VSERLRGFVLAALAFVAIFFGWKVADEYRYYQVVKKEHQAFFAEEFGRTSEGKPFTRKMFFDAMVAESARLQAEKAKTARKE
jgi:hypothetical protein